jgi:hypothetical protein
MSVASLGDDQRYWRKGKREGAARDMQAKNDSHPLRIVLHLPPPQLRADINIS